MRKATRFAKRMICLAACVLTLVCMILPASAAMVDLESQVEDRVVSNIRYSASFTATVIGCLDNGTALTVTGESGKFYKIECAGMRGYIAREQVAVDDNGYYYVNCNAGSAETCAMTGLTEQERTDTLDALLELAEAQIGTPYCYGGTRPGGFDCSGYVLYLYSSMGYSLNRTASAQLENGILVDREDLQPGDLVFFRGTGSGYISSHVGIYTGEGQFLHASSSGIQYDSLDSSYWSGHYLTARRILVNGTAVDALVTPPVKTNRSSGQEAGAFLLGIAN